MKYNPNGRTLPSGRKLGKVGVYGEKTRQLQRRMSYEMFGLTMKTAMVYKYLGSRSSVSPHINDIQNRIWFEVPDRAYECDPIEIPVGTEPIQEVKTDFSRWGLIDPNQDESTFRFHVDDMTPLDRTIIVGDVFEIPFYQTDCDSSFWEVTDVDRRSEQEKYLVIVTATPLTSSRKTREIRDNSTTEDSVGIAVDGFLEEISDQVPADLTTFDVDELMEKEEVDYRNELQSSFLDDPNKTF